MPSTISRLKSTDSLGQWASKTNQIIDTVEGFLSTAGSITSGNSLNYIATYSGSTWVGYPASGDVSAAISSGNLVFTLTTAAFTGKTVTSSITPASDLILIYSGGAVKTVTPATLATPGGSNNYVQYNNSGAFGGASGFTFASGVLSVPTGLNVNTNNLFVGSSKVGIGTGSPATTLDVYGNISISGTQVLSSTTLGSGVVNSSLTSVGTLGSLTVTGTASVGSLSSSGSVQGSSLTVTGTASVGSVSSSASSNASVNWVNVYTSGHWGQYTKIVVYEINTYYNPGFAKWYVDGTTVTNLRAYGSTGSVTSSQTTVGTATHSGQNVYRYNITFSNPGTYHTSQWLVGVMPGGGGVGHIGSNYTQSTADDLFRPNGGGLHMLTMSQTSISLSPFYRA